MNEEKIDKSPKLEAAIEYLHSAFKPKIAPDTIAYCECCMNDSQIEKLLTTNLKSLSKEDLEEYTRCLLLTVGELEDFQYFLPRIFELLCDTPVYLADYEVTFAKFRLADWKSWDEPKQTAINRFLEAVWLNEISKHEPETSTILCSIGQCEDDLGKYLDLLIPPQALRDLIESNQDCLGKGKLSDSFWEEREEQMKQVIHWLNSDPVQAMICKVYEQ